MSDIKGVGGGYGPSDLPDTTETPAGAVAAPGGTSAAPVETTGNVQAPPGGGSATGIETPPELGPPPGQPGVTHPPGETLQADIIKSALHARYSQAPSTEDVLAGRAELRRGQEGDAVRELQNQLNQHGSHLAEDGMFGPKTLEAVKQFQRDNGLRPESGVLGRVDARTLVTLNPEAQPPANANEAVTRLANQATASGVPLTAAQQQQLTQSLNGLNANQLQTEYGFLRDHVTNSPNADRATATYIELRQQQAQHPDRLTNDLVHTLTQGVADRRTDASPGQEGVLTQESALRAADALVRMPQSEYDRVVQSLGDTNQLAGGMLTNPWGDAQAEQSLILKAVAARHDALVNPSLWDQMRMGVGMPSQPMADIQNYADQIRGMNRTDLITQSTVLDLDGDATANALQQRFHMSCTPTAQQMARAEADPIYARQLHQEAIHSTSATGAIADEQRTLLEGHGGVARARDQADHGIGMWPEGTLNEMVTQYNNHVYTRHDLADTPASRRDALNRIDGEIRRGVDVPIVVAWDGGGSHSQLITDVRGNTPDRQYLVTDPANGETKWISEQNIVNGHTNFMCGTGRLWVTYE